MMSQFYAFQSNTQPGIPIVSLSIDLHLIFPTW